MNKLSLYQTITITVFIYRWSRQ